MLSFYIKFCTDRQKDRHMDTGKTHLPQFFQYGGIKICRLSAFCPFFKKAYH